MVTSAAKCQGNVREFHGAGDWSLVTLQDVCGIIQTVIDEFS